jgi:hypothetical protein
MTSTVLRSLIPILVASLIDVSSAFSQRAADFKSGLGYYYETDGRILFLGSTTQVSRFDYRMITAVGISPYLSGVNLQKAFAALKRSFDVDVPQKIGTVEFSELQKKSHKVKKDVRLFAYGLDFTRLGPDPPADNFAFCYISSNGDPVGPSPVRLYPIAINGLPIYELVVPNLVSEFANGRTQHAMWFINTSYDCTHGWLFQFPSSVAIKEPLRSHGAPRDSYDPNSPMPAPVEAAPDTYLSPSPGVGTPVPPPPVAGIAPPGAGTPIPPPPVADTPNTR